MGIVQRQGILASVGNYTGVILGYLNMVIFYPNVLGADEFGVIRLLVASATVLAQFGEMGLGSAVIRFFPRFRNSPEFKASLFSLIVLASIFTNLILLGALFLFRAEVNDLFSKGSALFNVYYPELIVMTIGVAFSEVFFGIARAQLKNIAPVFIRELLLRIVQTFLIALAYTDAVSFEAFCFAFALSYPMQGLLMLAILITQKRFSVSWSKGPWPERKSAVFKYASYMALMRIPNGATVHIDVIMLGALADLKSVAVYSIAIFLANIIMIPARTINQISMPLISRDLESKNMDKVSVLFGQSVSALLVISGLIFLVMNTGIEILSYFTKIEGIQEVGLLTFILGTGKLINAGSGVSWSILNQSEFYKRSFVISILFVGFSIIANYILIIEYQILGAAIATSGSFLFYSTIKLIALKRWLNVSTNLLRPAGFLLFLVLWVSVLKESIQGDSFVTVLFRVTAALIPVLLILFKWNISPEITLAVQSFIEKLKKK